MTIHPHLLRRSVLTLLVAVLAAAGCQDPPSQAAPDDTTPQLDSTPETTPLDTQSTEDTPPQPDSVDTNVDNEPWRSALFPADWSPGFTDSEGRSLHDFSYAGYHNGSKQPAVPPGARVVDVVLEHAADPTGATDATAALQAAIDDVSGTGGGVVMIPEGLYRLDGTLSISTSGVVLQGESSESSRLYFTQHEGMSNKSHITFRGAVVNALETPLAEDAEDRKSFVEVDDPTGFAVGQDVAIGWEITPEFVERHGMTEIWKAFNGTWQPIFRREIVAIDTTSQPARILLDVPLRYDARISDGASIRVEVGAVSEVGVVSLGLANGVGFDEAWAQDQVHVLEMHGVKDAWIHDVRSFLSPVVPTEGAGAGGHLQSSGVLIRASKRVTVSDSRLVRAQHRGPGGNGYLFEIRTSNEILVRDCVGLQGRHNFIQNWGFGTSGVVWLRVHSEGGKAFGTQTGPASTGVSEFHHSLAMACLIDQSVMEDGWASINRMHQSSGAGHTATETVLWNTRGTGSIRSFQYGWGYVIGTDPAIKVYWQSEEPPPGFEEVFAETAPWNATEPLDFMEGLGRAATLEPASLYEAQLGRRLEP